MAGGDGVVPVDDGFERSGRVGVQGVVGHAPGLVGRQVGRRLLEQDAQQLVGGAAAHDRPEHPDRAWRRASLATRPTATADFPDLASVPARYSPLTSVGRTSWMPCCCVRA